MVSSRELRHEHEQETTTLSGGAGVVEPDGSHPGPAEPLLLTPWV